MIRLGLKIYSSDVCRIPAIKRLFMRGLFDYIELYVLPGTFRSTAASWRSINIPYIVHAAHASHGFNLSIRAGARKNIKIFNEARRFADLLDALYIICHPGVQGSSVETIAQLKRLADDRILIENKPVVSLDGKRCVGVSPAEIHRIIAGARCGLCFDAAHCVKYCYTEGRDLFGEYDRFIKMQPSVVHLCDGSLAGCFDEHFAFGSGDFPLDEFCRRIRRSAGSSYVTVETPKRARQWESDVERDFLFINPRIGRKPRKKIVLRNAVAADMRRILLLSNDTDVRRNSFKSRRICLNEHKRWFFNKLGDDRSVFLVAEIGGDLIGQMRFDITDSSALVSISIAKGHRGLGLGRIMMARSLGVLKKTKPAVKLVNAYVKINNRISCLFFEKAGFFRKAYVIINGQRVARYCHFLKGT